MLISELIEHLQRRLEMEGDILVTMTGTLHSEERRPFADAFESTVETTDVIDHDFGALKGKRLKIMWQR